MRLVLGSYFLPRSSSSDVSRYVGVDGCSGGWFAVAYDPEKEIVDHALFDEFTAVVDTFPTARRILVDMPIGLPETGRRACDEAARDRLGSRASTVFFAPCRAVLDAPDHETASAVNREHTGYGLSIQAWHLVPRIREVDALLRSSTQARERVIEAHPELCFAALGEGPIEASKSTAAGQEARLDRLGSVFDAEVAYEACLGAYLRRDVARDDVLDAFVLTVSAAGALDRVPPIADEDVPRDGVGLPMEIRFPASETFDA
jgi:predicted RNase H-like nuclease